MSSISSSSDEAGVPAAPEQNNDGLPKTVAFGYGDGKEILVSTTNQRELNMMLDDHRTCETEGGYCWPFSCL
jgi:hypothetical protein